MKTYKFQQFNLEIKNPTVTPNKDSILLNTTNSTISVSVLLQTDSSKYGVLLEDIPCKNMCYEGEDNLLEKVLIKLDEFSTVEGV
jgi:hypothetical protein